MVVFRILNTTVDFLAVLTGGIQGSDCSVLSIKQGRDHIVKELGMQRNKNTKISIGV